MARASIDTVKTALGALTCNVFGPIAPLDSIGTAGYSRLQRSPQQDTLRGPANPTSKANPCSSGYAGAGLLRQALDMRDRGDLASHVQFWAVANPNTELDDSGMARLAEKIGAGAQVIVTQPPLGQDSLPRWLEQVDRRGLLGEAQFVIGVPVLTSQQGYMRWCQLCQCSADPVTSRKWAQLEQHEEQTRQLMEEEELRLALQSVESLRLEADAQRRRDETTARGVVGYHIMPIFRRSWRVLARYPWSGPVRE
mmetsp:Transcript_1882/g.6738  ORF Transcript_1882/g.6738 Transcript_1882/m.6738 type:complete len:253 (-) Transcript_1882:124-882(-)|eukprot:scaffold5277_cov404-Prasinococcus_capsulatus_cf.AAC.15